jgi:NHL repeat
MEEAMKTRTYAFIGGVLFGAIAVAVAGWQQRATADDYGKGAPKPSFAVDASWPKPLPAPVGDDGKAHTWVQGEVAGNCIDRHDNVYTFNRGWQVGLTGANGLQGNQSGAIVGQDATAGGAIPSPPVVVFNSDGDTIAGWGNPSLIQPPAGDYGYAAYLPQGPHGCFVDYQGYVWLGGNGDGIVQKYNPATAAPMKDAATFVAQIGSKGMCDGTPTNANNPFSSCGETNDHNTSHTLLNEPPDMAVDPLPDPVTGTPGSVYIADGYGNHRVVVYTTSDGGKTYTYNRQWGQACVINGVRTNSQSCPAGTFGASGGGHPHCVVLGNDGLVYVCDRPNSRIQVFDRSCGAASNPNTNFQPLCLPKKIINIGLDAGQTPPNNVPVVGDNAFASAEPGDRAAILGSLTTRSCDIDFWPNVDYLATKSPTSQAIIVNADLNNDNTWLIDKATAIVFGALGACGIAPCPGHNAAHFAFSHTTAVDSKGNIYVAETVTGRRIQKFVQVKSGYNY